MLLEVILGRVVTFWCVGAVFAFLGIDTASGADFDEAVAAHQERLITAIHRLNTLRAKISDKQIPLSKQLSTAREEAKGLRSAFEKRRSAQASKHLELHKLEERVLASSKEIDYISRTLFSEYLANYEASLSSGERGSYGKAIKRLHLFGESSEGTRGSTLRRSLEVVEGSLERIYSVLGGKVYEGEALGFDGILVSGNFVQAGPVLFFADRESDQFGLIVEGLSLRPRVRRLDGSSEALIAAYENGESDLLPVDPSLENALLLNETKESLMGHLRKGGVWVYPIVFFALLACVVAVYKFAQIFVIREPDPMVAHELSRLLRDGDREQALSVANRQPEPARAMLVNAVEHADEPLELVEEVMYESMLSVQPKLERFLNVIAVTAATAPLLGLLGTVTGIIKTFKLMHVFGAGDPKPLIAGISEALITTELGLVLAIPSLIIHALLSRKVAGVLARLEKLSVALVNSLSRRSVRCEFDV
ncbi:MAG: MotA/TolQ/ExbB proton channel family protein [Opitutales bacterium]